MSKVLLEEKKTIDRLVEMLDDQRPSPLEQLKKGGKVRFDRTRLPHAKDEDWRFLRLDPLTSTEFRPAPQLDETLEADLVSEYGIPEAEQSRLAFVNGAYRDDLSNTEAIPEGVKCGSLGEPVHEAKVDEYLGDVAGWYEEDFFASLNAAAATDGAYLFVPPNTTVETPIHLFYASTSSEEPFLANPRNLIVVGDNSRVTLVEHYVGEDDETTYFNNSFNEIEVGRDARITHVKAQEDSESAFHFERTSAHIDQGGNYASRRISLGAKLSRYDIYSAGESEHIDCTLDGLAVLNDEQISDTHSVMDHREPRGDSHQLHKMILDDDSHAVFNGKIFVRQDAQVIDAYQLNRTLLLSDDAKVNTKPQLEIFADDVVCTHGATVGQLEEDQLFYLRSRGLDPDEARNLLIFGFAAEVLEPIPVESLKDRLGRRIQKQI